MFTELGINKYFLFSDINVKHTEDISIHSDLAIVIAKIISRLR